MRYELVPDLTRLEVEAALKRDESNELHVAVLSAALCWDDATAAEALCLRLAAHSAPNVRGNAVLGIGHLARRFGTVSARSAAAVEAARSDEMEYVRGQAEAAADDLKRVKSDV